MGEEAKLAEEVVWGRDHRPAGRAGALVPDDTRARAPHAGEEVPAGVSAGHVQGEPEFQGGTWCNRIWSKDRRGAER